MSTFIDNENLNVNERQINYLEYVAAHLDEFIPKKDQDKWCLLFGNQVLFTFDNEEEARQTMEHVPVHLCLFAPKKPETPKTPKK
jgi:hypothetical protein